jgi:heme oxygenase
LHTVDGMLHVSGPLVRLNLETRPHHAAADEGWVALMRGGIRRQDYVRQLVTTYGFEAPLEAALAYTPHLKLVIDLRARSRAGLLAQDLLELGIDAAELAMLPQCTPIAPFSAPIEALGWMYVIERATLLHDWLRRHVRANPEIAAASSYVSAYGGETAARWSELGHVLDRVARTERLVDELVAAAHAGFRCLVEWSRGDRTAYARGA